MSFCRIYFQTQTAADAEIVPAEGEVAAEVEADPAQVALVIAKRQAPELTDDCMVYRYGSLSTSVDVVRKSVLLLLGCLSALPYTSIETLCFHGDLTCSLSLSLSTLQRGLKV